ncbi:hypothetical protein A7985_21510 [Pseudoalteromonas luteoviolacea]|uniref:Uncharacterized protein n=1 Tax=Pseudoalteromonas luteoviolacea TaxID=43657 RepID=A0A1C0TKF1_9GAMM|nr:hypothetical protein [Pseudoalteromonas luteoviolacea]OCQ19031.1 hypothetical protein A7985_21510 [Pseudoalteromonas luteoviolacea]
MGIRSALKKELMNLDALGLMTADDVRAYLNAHLKRAKDKFALISRFNTHHSQVQAGLPSTEKELKFERHRLFKDVLYPKSAVQKWAAQTH